MSKKKIISWALYDLANTIFATNIISLYFPLWVIIQKGAADKFYILPYYVSMLLAAFVLLATPLMITNATGVIDEREMTTGADWDYRVYGDANGNRIIVRSNFGQDDELQDMDEGPHRIAVGDLGGMAKDDNGGEPNSAGWWGKCNGYAYIIIVNGGAYPADAVEAMEANQIMTVLGTPGGDFGEFMTALYNGENNDFHAIGWGGAYPTDAVDPLDKPGMYIVTLGDEAPGEPNDNNTSLQIILSDGGSEDLHGVADKIRAD